MGGEEDVGGEGCGNGAGREAVDLVGTEGPGAAERDRPGQESEAVASKGGAKLIDLVTTGDEKTADRSEALDGVADDRGMPDGGLLQEVQVRGVVDVSQRVELMVLNADVRQVDMSGAPDPGTPRIVASAGHRTVVAGVAAGFGLNMSAWAKMRRRIASVAA